MNNLQKLLRIQQQELVTSFKKAQIGGERTPQEISDRRESAMHDFLRGYFPFPYKVGKGNICDSKGNRSNSIDALVINPSHPHTVDKGNYSFIVAEGVDYAIELKSNLNNKEEIKRALKQTQSVKKLRRVTCGVLPELMPPKAGKKMTLKPPEDKYLQIPMIIFSHSTYQDKKFLIEEIVSYYAENRIPVNEQFDFLCCLDGTFVLNSNKMLHFFFQDIDGFIFKNLGEDILYYFFYFLTAIPESTPLMKEKVLKPYLNPPPNEGWKKFPALNDKLRSFEFQKK